MKKFLQRPLGKAACAIAVMAAIAIAAVSTQFAVHAQQPVSKEVIVGPSDELKPAPRPSPTDPDLLHAKSLSNAFRKASAAVMPSVVKIKSSTKAKDMRREGGRGELGGRNPFEGTPFEDLFNNEELGRRFKDFKMQPRNSLGSGVIIDKEGIVLTNNHVVQGADTVTVILSDGTEYTASEIKTDPRTDLAVMRIFPNGEKLPAAKLGDSDALDIGDWVIAIGHPFELEKSVSAGIISAKGRQLNSASRASFLQTDAAINPGNSGGPLVNLDGEVIGINTAIATSNGSYQGVGFAIPINLAKWISGQLVKKGTVERAYLGVQIGQVTPELARQFDVKPSSGVLVANVFPKSPAAEAGMKDGDIITEFAGHRVSNPQELQLLVERADLNSKHPVKLLRNGKAVTANVGLKTMPRDFETADASPAREKSPDKNDSYSHDSSGMVVGPLSEELAEQLGHKGHEGVVITAVENGSPAEEKGLQPGMLVVKVGKQAVTNLGEFKAAMKDQSVEKGILLLVRARDNRQFFVVLKK